MIRERCLGSESKGSSLSNCCSFGTFVCLGALDTDFLALFSGKVSWPEQLFL